MTQNKMLINKVPIIGITGNSGSGKTTVCDILASYSGHIIDADKAAHKAMEPGKPAYIKIVSAFGPDILSSGNKIDRKKLGSIVFNDINKRTLLESIVHPLVIEDILTEISSTDALFIAIDAVLLVESGLHHHCSTVWLVTAPDEARLNRIIVRDGLSTEAAAARMRNQRDTAPIAAIAQITIQNDGDIKALHSRVVTALDTLEVIK